MKKRIFAVMTALFVLTMSSFAVSAAISPTAENAAILADAASSENGSTEVLDQDTLADALSFVEDMMSMFGETIDAGETPEGAPITADSPVAAIIAQISEDASAEGEAVEIVPEVKAAFDFVPDEDVQAAIAANGSAQVTFALDVEEGDNIIFLHFNGTEWEVIVPDEISNGVVKATFTSFSPIVVVELTSESETAADEAVSPKTGEAVALIALASVLCGAGATVCGKKSKETK